MVVESSILLRMENIVKKPRTQLDRAAWVAGATEVLAEEGIAGLRVEVLAKRLKVTKGSFYWHFTDRRDLLMAVLAHWKEGRIRDIIKQTRAQPGRELEQIYHVIDVYSASRSRRGMMIELAVRDWARRDAEAGAIVAEVTMSACAARATSSLPAAYRWKRPPAAACCSTPMSSACR